jgi:ribonucleotide reductase beta subunit family protein with ferritin-like domain
MRRINHQEDFIMYTTQTNAECGLRADQAAFLAALDRAQARSLHSYFTQYILTDAEAGYITIDEGDYGAFPQALLHRVIDTVPSQMSDEF